MGVGTLGHGPVAEEGVRLVRQRKDEVRLISTCIFVRVNHRDAVEEVSRVHHDGGEDGGEDGGSRGEEPDAHVLHRARVDEDGHGGGPQGSVPGVSQQDAEADAQHDVARHDGNGCDKRLLDGLFAHGWSLAAAPHRAWCHILRDGGRGGRRRNTPVSWAPGARNATEPRRVTSLWAPGLVFWFTRSIGRREYGGLCRF